MTEEHFAPILPLLKWSESDSVDGYGTGSFCWTKDADKATAMANQLEAEAGTVWLNTHFELGPTAPFGRRKYSGMG